MKKLIFMRDDLVDAVTDILNDADDERLAQLVSKAFDVQCEVDVDFQFNISCNDDNELTDYVDT